jgi:thioredoxin-related protein
MLNKAFKSLAFISLYLSNKMKFIFILFFFLSITAFGNDSTKLYNPRANVEKDVAAALQKAKLEKKHVLLQIGGNWCVMCYRFNSFIFLDTAIKKLVVKNYVLYHLNYSNENKNLAYLKKLNFPQKFGFPVLVVLNADGELIHTQDSTLLQKGNGYDTEKVKDFLRNWSPTPIMEMFYKD